MSKQNRWFDPERSLKQNLQNWVYYNKLWIVVGIVLVWIAASWIWNVVSAVQPDYQLAYVGESALSDADLDAIESAFQAYGADCNGDGKIVVEIHDYASSANSDAAAEAGIATEVTLMADLESCDSYFFLLQYPARFQASYQALAMADGSCPADEDLSADGKVYCWGECPALAEYGGDSLSTLSLGRRCFYGSKTVENPDACQALWEALTQGAQP